MHVRTFVCLDSLSCLNIKHVYGSINSAHSKQTTIRTLRMQTKQG